MIISRNENVHAKDTKPAAMKQFFKPWFVYQGVMA